LPYTIEILPAALKQLQALPRPDQRRIRDRIDRLADNPRPYGSSKLEGADDLHRIRVGQYRVIYSIQDKDLVVVVVRVGNRRDVYRFMK
jgi:mRNA interferase RelE/StbE